MSESDVYNRDDAEALCNEQGVDVTNDNETDVPTLAEILSSKEQKLIEEYVFSNTEVYDDVWVRAKRGAD